MAMLRVSRSSLWAARQSGPFLRSPARSRHIRSFASVTDLNTLPKPGEKLHGFTLQRTKHLPELELTALQLQHDKTGAEYLHIARDDANNVFSIGFKTNPPDRTGVPHILEHTTLCGSKKYPVRDPFFKMLPRSLSNFMNAFTSSDHTTYPFATTNAQDFRNLMSVYLDATLNPLLKTQDFHQEGWRIGPENPLAEVEGGSESAKSPLVFKGVVYNEMKGQMSDSGYLYYIRFHEQLYPSLNNSGGDPQAITDLTYEQLRNFHADHYHPSNAKVFTYGDMPVTDHLPGIGQFLDSFDKIAVDHNIKHPISLDSPKEVTIKGPIETLVPLDRQYKTSITWLMGDTSDVVENFSLSILSSLLMDGYGSPLYQSLIESGLGLDFSPNTGYSASTRRGVFSVGVTGVRKEDTPKVKETIQKVFADSQANGFNDVKVQGILHQLELGLKHKTAHFGMGLVQRLKPSWFNGIDPFDALAWTEVVDAFKQRYEAGGYFESLIEKYLVNERTFTFTMEPSESYALDLQAEEQERLSTKIAEASKDVSSADEAYARLAERELELVRVQEEARNQDLSCLPSVHVKDIPRQKERNPVSDSNVENVRVQWRQAPTNGLTYFRAINVLEGLPSELRSMLPLFSDAILRLGTKKLTMEQLEEQIKLYTGGINFGYHSTTSPHNLSHFEEGFSVSGIAFDRNIPTMYELIRTLITETNFDGPEAESKIRELLQTASSGAMDAIASSGHAYARRYALAGLSPAGQIREETSGLAQVQLLTALSMRNASEGLNDVVDKLKQIQAFALSKTQGLRLSINCGPESVQANEKALQRFMSGMSSPAASFDQVQPWSPQEATKIFFPLPYQVHYAGYAVPSVPYVDPSGASLQILAQLLTHKHLHHEIREKGGAYGGGAFSQGLEGGFGYYSYRDPNPLNTIKIMEEAGVWARDRTWTERDIEEAKLSVFQSLDAPKSVSQEGMTRFVSGIDDGMAQKRREQLLDVTPQDVTDAADRFLIQGAKHGRYALLGPNRDWITETAGWKFEKLELNQLDSA
ncbi:hypothetical protein P152DRAFT_471236 [Eremomyces bilateralis CBS 781.70]|uniref:Presequence protease, mitochondrial n=1 Tax=Eremomyces bilateralis CBS 781.70 TaxID=1392243 RepID=A0A6G1GCU1_9PEZI|nr:uncharacterized protein P152DRAFT_471236 [Eremomyces bilateralis CBS 781.70]KAF1815854.1 hypothetical protein P152DRAFT_471236 [Eremomyces bilateralis CBS 781.70]